MEVLYWFVEWAHCAFAVVYPGAAGHIPGPAEKELFKPERE
jgi:hypothetical protein